ncbi:unnamed protein product [Paramecium octaurelia]|uniref:Transmembrane protein n=1 Tax=Paramecium octaurelia TaxID=43137 RepID=A0A8S1YQS6_PAROT|nr:unnamed protein product [Paramecium octaurelia]CAD8214511.1 unnamed protein product [Paramecium octaurelia]CAD8215597.1 unnamed protein product [Paramecium octaurelia]
MLWQMKKLDFQQKYRFKYIIIFVCIKLCCSNQTVVFGIFKERNFNNFIHRRRCFSNYGTDNHIYFGLFYFVFLALDFLYFLEQLDKIKLRKPIGYLFNEYNSKSYDWEQIKLSKKLSQSFDIFESDVLLMASLLGLCLLFYQLLAVKQKPYIIQNLNFLDILTEQICSLSIFISAVKYLSEKEMLQHYQFSFNFLSFRQLVKITDVEMNKLASP